MDYLFVNNSLDVNGNTASFGVNGLNPGYSLIYTNGTPATVDFSASAPGVNWIWSQSTNQPQLKLDSSNTLSLYAPNTTTPAIVLNPAGASTFTQGLTVTGTLTASGGLASPNGIVTGGATGLTLQAGGTGNQNILLMPTGNGNVGIGTLTPSAKLEVAGDVTVTGKLNLASAPIINGYELGAGNGIGNLGVNGKNPSQWYSIGTYGYTGVLYVDASGDYAAARQLIQVNNLWNTAGVKIISRFDYGHKNLPIEYGMYKSGSEARVAIRLNPAAGSADLAGMFAIYDAINPSRKVLLEPVAAADVTLRQNPTVPDGGWAGNWSENYYIPGNLGVGTSAPQVKLGVNGNHFDTQIRLFSDYLNQGVNGVNTALLNIWASEPGWSWTGAGIGNNAITVTNGGVQRATATRGGSYVRLLDNMVSLNTIDSQGVDRIGLSVNAGNVGIGTTNPQSLLTLGSNLNSQNTTTSEQLYSQLLFQNSGNNYKVAAIAATQPAGNFQDAGALVFSTGYGSLVEKMRIMPLGNVGIGTTTPTVKLDVVGDAKVSGNLTVGGSVIGNVTSSAALSLAAGGINQNITLAPSGTGIITTAAPMTITNTLTASNVTTGGTVNAGTLKVTNVATSLTNLGIGTANTANFGAINAADPSFFYPAPVAKVSHTSTTGPFLQSPQVVTVAGNFAYVGSSSSTSFQILDITNPLLPVKRGSMVGTGGAAANLSYPRGIAISGSYAYVTSSTNNSLQVINIINPDAPVAAGSLLNGAGGALLSAPFGIAISGSYAYIASSTSKALEIVNITTPTAPTHAGQLTNTTWLNGARAVAVSGIYAYVVSNTGNSLAVINISNPATPTLVATLAHNAAGPLLAGPTAIAISGNYAYVTSSTSNALQIIDISNPLIPVAKGSLVNGASGAQLTSPSALSVVGNYAFVTASGTTKAVQIVDISNPLAPTPKGQLLDGIGGAALNVPTGIAVAGNYAYVTSSSSNALQVLSIASGGGFQIQNATVLTKDASNNLLLGSGLPAGKVAIGTTNATSRLTVAGIGTTAAASVVNFTDSTNKSLMFVQNDGKVGIGTTVPAEKLDVVGNIKLSGSLLIPGTGTDFFSIQNLTTGNDSEVRLVVGDNALDGEADRLTIGAMNWAAGGAWYPRFTVMSSGNVGIGTTTPTTKLDVAGDAKISGATTLQGDVTVKTVLRIPPSGDLDMGSFKTGTNPNPPAN